MTRTLFQFILLLLLVASLAIAALAVRSYTQSDVLLFQRAQTSYLLRIWDGTLFLKRQPQTPEDWTCAYLVIPVNPKTPIPWHPWSWTITTGQLQITCRAWALSALLALPPFLACLAATLKRTRLHLRKRRNHCTACNYDLRFSPTLCPECGLDPALPLPPLRPLRTAFNHLTTLSAAALIVTITLWILSHTHPTLITRAHEDHLYSLTSSPGQLSFRRFAPFDSDLNEAHLYSDPTTSLWSDTAAYTLPGLQTFTGLPRKARLYHTILPYAGFSISYWLAALLFSLLPSMRLISPRSTPHQ